MAAPTVVAVGSPNSGVNNVTVTLPPHQAGDILLVVAECSESAGISAPSGGWAHITNSPRPQGSNVTCCNVFWLRATGSGTTNPSLPDPGNHIVAFAAVIRGAVSSGNPWDFAPVGDGAAGASSFSADNGTTTVADTLICAVVAGNTDTATDQFSSVSMSGVSGFTEQDQAFTASGNGGGISLYTATRTTAGSPGSCDGTIAGTATWSSLVFAIKPLTDVTVNLGQSSDTDSAAALTLSKSATVGQATETDSAQPVVVAKAVTAGQASGSDAASPLAVAKAVTAGQASDTDQAHPTSLAKTVTAGQAEDTDSAFALGFAKAPLTVGQATGTDAAQPTTVTKTITLGLASETDEAFPVSTSSSTGVTLGQATGTDTALPVVAAKTVVLGQATETAVAQPLVLAKTTTAGLASSAESAAALTLAKTVIAGQAEDTDAVAELVFAKAATLELAEDTDTAHPVTAAQVGVAPDIGQLATVGGRNPHTTRGGETPYTTRGGSNPYTTGG